MNKIKDLSFHHIAIVVENIEKAIKNYSYLFGSENISDISIVKSEKVKVSFIKIAQDSFIELVQPTSDDSKVYNLLKKKINYYHLAYKVKDILKTIDKLEKMNYKLIDVFESEAFNGSKCAFVYSPDGHLMELIEK